MSDFVFLHQEKINFGFLKLLKPNTFKAIISTIYLKKKVIYLPEKSMRYNVIRYS